MKAALEITFEITKLVKYSPRREWLLEEIKDEIACAGSPGVTVLCPQDGQFRLTPWWTLPRTILFWTNYGTKLVRSWRIQRPLHESEVLQLRWHLSIPSMALCFCLAEHFKRSIYQQLKAKQLQLWPLPPSLHLICSWKSLTQWQWNMMWMSQSFLGSKNGLGDMKKAHMLSLIGLQKICIAGYTMKHLIWQRKLSRIVLISLASYTVYQCLENLLLKAAKGEDFSEELKLASSTYGSDIHECNLQMRLQTLGATIPKKVLNIFDVRSYLQQLMVAEICCSTKS